MILVSPPLNLLCLTFKSFCVKCCLGMSCGLSSWLRTLLYFFLPKTGDISSIEIDQFTFSPGPHELLINFTCVNGDTGKFVYEFEGETRPSKLSVLNCHSISPRPSCVYTCMSIAAISLTCVGRLPLRNSQLIIADNLILNICMVLVHSSNLMVSQ